MHDNLSELEQKIEYNFKTKTYYYGFDPPLVPTRTRNGARTIMSVWSSWGCCFELVVTEYLYKTYPNPEGELTNWRAALVNAVTLSKITSEFDLNDYILLSKGEARDTAGPANISGQCHGIAYRGNLS